MRLTEDRRAKPGLKSGERGIPLVSTGVLRVLIPGLAQWNWRQRERGLVFLVSFAASLAASLLCWGNFLGWVFLGFAFLTHTAATLDLVRQRAFPVFHARITLVAVIFGLGVSFYVPLAKLLSLYAFPALSSEAPGVGYLVNSRAYLERGPVPGQWIWLHDRSHATGVAGQVIAVAGQEVEWTGRRWEVDGKALRFTHPGSLPYYPASWRFQVPRDHVLIDRELATMGPPPALTIVSQDQIVGRAWARYYPFWDRCLL
jgi:hypothetical protein